MKTFIRRTMIIAGIPAALVLLCVLYIVFEFLNPPPLTPPTPDFLKYITANGGSSDFCPPENEKEAKRRGAQISASPDIEQRLTLKFPNGTPEVQLVDFLKKENFATPLKCKTDSSIHSASFNQDGGNGISLIAMGANVYWKVDTNSRIQWIKGRVSYIGL